MKFAIAYYLLLIYATVILKPLIPFAEDALVHCFAEAYHVATVHAVYGNNHIEKELAANSDNNEKNNKADINTDSTSVHVAVIEQLYSFEFIQPAIFYHMPLKFALPQITLSGLIQPPKFSYKKSV